MQLGCFFFFSLCLFHFPFYYHLLSLTMPSHFFPLDPPACSRDAGTSRRWRSCSLCIPSVLHLSFKKQFLENSPFHVPSEEEISIPVLAMKSKKLLSSLVCMAGVRTGPPAPSGVQLYQQQSQKKPQGGEKHTPVDPHHRAVPTRQLCDRTRRRRNPQLKLNPPQVEQWQKGQVGEDGCCCAEKQESNNGEQREVNTHRYYSDRAQ